MWCKIHIKNIIIWMMVLLFVVNPESLTTIICNNDACETNCSSENCENRIIDGSGINIKSFTIVCDENSNNYKCINTTILCPQNGICYIHCNIDDGCKNMQILSNGNKADIYLYCHEYSCSNLLIDASSINLVDIKAIGHNSLTHSQIYSENVNKFILNCGGYGIISNDACLQNNLYLPSPIDNNNQVTINCFGESCRGSSIHVIHGMNGIDINILSNCQCNNDINKCKNYWYLFCDTNYKETNMGYVTFRDYQCLTDDIKKCDCNTMQQYVIDNFKNDENDANIICDIDIDINNDNMNNNNNNNENMLNIIDTENDLWTEIGDFMRSDHTIIWIIMAVMILITLIIMCYLCAIKMNKYNEIHLVPTYDSDDLESDHANI